MEPTAQQLRVTRQAAPRAGRQRLADPGTGMPPAETAGMAIDRPSMPVGLHARGELTSDDALVREAQAGDAAAREALARRYRGRVYVFALALLQRPEDAEDAAQETFIRAFGSLGTYEPRGHFRAWLLAIAANVCRAHGRHERRRASHAAEEEWEETSPATGAIYAQAALREAVRAAIARLPAVYRGPVVLYYLEELPVAEVASILGRSRAAVKVQLWRARSLLARELVDWLD
jgi:RNA polymerase sigma factor (sigma-70 family)